MRSARTFLMDLGLVVTAIAAAAIVVALGLWAAGYPALEVLRAWVGGAVGSRTNLLVALKGACPLVLTGLAAGVAFRSGVLNIGAEGQSLLGSLGAVAVATRLCAGAPWWLAIPVALLAAALAGAFWASIAAAMQRYRGVPMVLSTILLNIIALQLLGILLEGPLKATGTEVVQSDVLPGAYWLPIMDGYSKLHIGILIALATAGACWLVQARTAYGFELLVTGLNPTAARLAGMPVTARQFGVMLWSGAFAGLAGAIQVMGVEGHSLVSTVTTYGYAGIAVALLGRLHPAGIVAAALFFGMLDRGATEVSFPPYLLPQQVADIVKGLVVIVILVGTAYVARPHDGEGALKVDAAGEISFILNQALISATPLLLAGFGELLAERAGIINVGIEGTMLMGAIAAYAAAIIAGTGAAVMPAAIGMGLLCGGLFAVVVIWLRADQVVTGTAMNILAAGSSATAWELLRAYMTGTPRHDAPALSGFFHRVSPLSWIPFLGPVFDQYALFYGVAALGVVLFFLMHWTRLGLVIRSLGDAPDACNAAGIRVRAWRTMCVLFAGACAGAAGAYLSTMRNYSFQNNMTDGKGFLVLALVIFGRWSIGGLVAGTLCFGALDGLQVRLAGTPGATAHIPHQLFDMLPYVATLAALAILARGRAGPAFLGKPWPEDR